MDPIRYHQRVSFDRDAGEGLNPPQREAVQHGDGPLLILAGAGSGKTRVITHRLARLVERGVPPWRILAVTFTNKAAGEMRARAARLLDEQRARRIWIGTFHATCAKLLRLHAAEAGLRADFQIYDDDDSKKLVTRAMKDLVIPERAFTPRGLLGKIDQAKNEGVDAASYVPRSYQEELVARVYVEYQRRLHAANAVDFGDLLLEALRLFEHPEAGRRLASRFDYVLVDEFQDTNRVQYRLVQRLATTGNLCVVGDDDQSIYRWRGADVRNILDFERDYPGCRVVKLEQNYRSTAVVLEAANGVISRNVHRKPKRLFTETKGGEPIVYFTGFDERREAEFIVRAIRQLAVAEGRAPGDFAVLYRMHAQSRALEEALRAARLPYAVFGGVRFFDRAEVKDLLAYLRVMANPADEVSLERIVNVPPRGIGDTTLDRVARHAWAQRITSWEAMREAAGLGAQATRRPRREPAPAGTPLPGQLDLVPPRAEPASEPEPSPPDEPVLGSGPRRKLAAFVQLVDGLRDQLHRGGSLSELATATLDASGLLERLQADDSEESRNRLANLEELLNSIRDYEREASAAGEAASLVGYLERVSLQSSADAEGGGVALMTVHAAKGLEFPVVFLAGLEEGTFPLLQAGDELEKLEEERRLAYVAITRARERLVLTNAARRRLFRERHLGFETAPLDADDALSNRESRFVADIPEHCICRPVRARPTEPAAARRRAEARDDGTWVEREGEEHDGASPHRGRAGPPAGPSTSSVDEEPWVEYDAGPDVAGGFRIGQRVRHVKFGEGQVRHLSGTGEALKLTVDFAGEEKTIVARYVQPV